MKFGVCEGSFSYFRCSNFVLHWGIHLIGRAAVLGGFGIFLNPSFSLIVDFEFGFQLICLWKVKSKTSSSSSRATTKTTTTVTTAKVREKKVYNLPGQKCDPPEEVCTLILDGFCC